MNRREVFGLASAVVALGLTSRAGAEEPPIKIGMSMPQTGGLAAGGKASLLGIEIWRDDINARGGLLGRKV
jgi:branched-chain amino acid transport system substrate-binding protein